MPIKPQIRRHDQESKANLLLSMRQLLSNSKDRLDIILRDQFPGASLALLVHFIPEQGEDIYIFLIDTGHVACVELPRNSTGREENTTIEVFSISQYQERISGRSLREFQLALEILREQKSL